MLTALAAAVLMQAAPAATPAAAPPASTASSTANTVSPLTIKPEVSISKRREVDLKAMVCTSELPIGSRFPVKTCATRGDRLQRTREDQADIRQWIALRPGSGN